MGPSDGYAAAVLPGVIVAGLGSGLGFPALATAAMTGTTEADAGLASAVLTAVQQLGGAVGLAFAVTLAAQRGDAGVAGAAAVVTDGFPFALAVCATLLAVGAVAVTVALRGAARRPPWNGDRRLDCGHGLTRDLWGGTAEVGATVDPSSPGRPRERPIHVRGS